MSKRKPELKLVEDTGSELLAEELLPEPPPQQGEMPFALVEGQPMTELPRDLYIPPDALQVFLEAFEGPLDLLLYLIRKQNLDILDIPIAEITRQYMKYIEVMADLQLELAGEYLLMAAMLAEIKSRMLLPRPPSAEGQDEDDPRAELVRRLQEYERFKKAAEDIDRLTRLERDTMPASAELQERKVVTLQPDVTLKEMLSAFKDVLARAEKFAHHHITRERLSQRERMSEILDRLQTQAFFEFTQLFRPEEGRMGVTVTFIAILELMKEGLIEIVQAEAYAPIHVRTAQRHLKVVAANAAVAASTEADAENAAALAQPELDGENDVDEEAETPAAATQPEDAAVEGALAEAEAVAVALGVDDVVVGDVSAEPAAVALLADDVGHAPVEPSAVALGVDDVFIDVSAEPASATLGIDDVVVDGGDAPSAAELATADDLSVTTPLVDELAAEAAEPVVVADAEHPVSEVTVAEIADTADPIVVTLDTAADELQSLLATSETSGALAAAESQELGAVESIEAVAADEVSASDTQALAIIEPDEQATVSSEHGDEPPAVAESDEQAASTLDAQALATSASEEQAAVDSELTQETFAAPEPDEQPAAASNAQALASESDEHVVVVSELGQETFAAPESDEQVAFSAEQGTEESAAIEPIEQPASALDEQSLAIAESGEQAVVSSEHGHEISAATEPDEQPASALDAQALATSESDDNSVVRAELDQEGLVGTASDGLVAVDADRGTPRPAGTESEEQLASELDEQGGESPGSGEQVVDEQASLAPIASSKVPAEETSTDAHASVIDATEASDEGAALETVVEEHPVASADTDATNEAVADQSNELSVSDDSVTESSSEADNSDAEPSR